MKKLFLHLTIYGLAISPMVFAQTSVTVTGPAPKTTIEAQYQEAKEKIKVDEENIQRMEEQKKDSEAQVEIDKATLKKYKAQLEEDKRRVDRLEEQLNLEEEE
jgi:hypothetical protein